MTSKSSSKDKIWLPESFDSNFKASLETALHSVRPPPLPPRPIDTPDSPSSPRPQEQREILQMRLDQYKEGISSACDHVLECANERLKYEERKSNLIASDAGPMYYQSWLLANISGDRFERFWVAMENDILYLCRKPTTVPSNYEDVLVACVRLPSTHTPPTNTHTHLQHHRYDYAISLRSRLGTPHTIIIVHHHPVSVLNVRNRVISVL